MADDQLQEDRLEEIIDALDKWMLANPTRWYPTPAELRRELDLTPSDMALLANEEIRWKIDQLARRFSLSLHLRDLADTLVSAVREPALRIPQVLIRKGAKDLLKRFKKPPTPPP